MGNKQPKLPTFRFSPGGSVSPPATDGAIPEAAVREGMTGVGGSSAKQPGTAVNVLLTDWPD